MSLPEEIARRFHETYERLAPEYGYETRKESAVPWDDVPEQNKALMVAVAAELFLLDHDECGHTDVDEECPDSHCQSTRWYFTLAERDGDPLRALANAICETNRAVHPSSSLQVAEGISAKLRAAGYEIRAAESGSTP